MKKVLCVLMIMTLAMTMLLTACKPSDESSGEQGTGTTESLGALEFKTIGNGICSVIGIGTYTGTHLAIPEESPKGEKVVSIGDNAFSECVHLTSLVIPAGVTEISQNAFQGCTGLESITVSDGNSIYYSQGNCLISRAYNGLILGCKTSIIPDGVTSISRDAFQGCTGLTSITIPDSVTFIAEYTFQGCTGLESITVREGNSEYYSQGNCLIKKENDALIDGCKTSIIPDGVKSIESGAFRGCTGLTNLVIPASVTEISWQSFFGCTGLTSITVSEENPEFYSQGNCLITRDSKSLILGCNTSVIPEDVTSIGWGAFYECSTLTSIVIPNSVTSIDRYAFYGCTGLTSITIPDSVTIVDFGAFYGCTGLTSITIPDSVKEIGANAFDGCTGLTIITIPDSVTYIHGSAFSGCVGLETIIVSNGNPIYFSAGNCIIAKENDVLILGCKTSVIHDGVKSIGEYAFAGCTELTSITIPDSVTSIGRCAFAGCTGLKSIAIGDGVTSIGGSAFSDCTSLTSITIPDSVTSIDRSVFYGCTGLRSITIPDSVTSIGSSAFYGCTSLTSITIGDGVTSIGEAAFRGCNGLEQIIVGENNPVYDGDGNCLIVKENSVLIFGCKTSEIPAGVTSIDKGAFYGCIGLTSITIPDTVSMIDKEAFSGCVSLTDVYYTGSEQQWIEELPIFMPNYELLAATIHYNYVPED